jgi:hypothetical protein
MEIIYADPVFCTLVGAESQDQRVGLSLTDIVMPEYHAALREQVTRIENEDEPVLHSSGEFLAIGVGDPVQSDGFYSLLCACGSFAPVDPIDLEADCDVLADDTLGEQLERLKHHRHASSRLFQ